MNSDFETYPTNAKEAFLRYLDVWGNRGPNTLDLIRTIHDKRINAIGTARHDIFHGIKEMETQWKKERQGRYHR